MRYLRTRSRWAAVGIVGAIALSACAGGTETVTDATETASSQTDDTTEDTTTEDTTSDDGMGDMDMSANAGDPFEQLRLAANHVGNNGTAKALVDGLDQALDLEGSTDEAAASTYATLATLLQEHVYLAGIAVDTAYSFGLDSPEFGLAAGALDVNSVELADVVGSVAPDQRDAFLELWRQHIGFFVDYAKGAAAGDQAVIDKAIEDLRGYGQQSGAFFESISGGVIPASAVEASLEMHVTTLGAAIEALAAGDAAAAFDNLKIAANHVVESSAKALAGGLDEALGLEGSIDSPAATTYVTVSTLLEEHVYLAGIAVKTGYAAGLDSDAFAAAAGELDENSVAIADVIGSVAPDQRDAFLELWRQHIGFFVDYAKGAATGDQAVIDQAVSDLEGYGQQSGAFFESISGGAIPASAVSGSLGGHIDTLGGAIKALAAAIVG